MVDFPGETSAESSSTNPGMLAKFTSTSRTQGDVGRLPSGLHVTFVESEAPEFGWTEFDPGSPAFTLETAAESSAQRDFGM